MDTKKYVDRFRKTIIDYDIPYDQVVIAPYSTSVTMFNGISVADYMTCDDQSVEQVAKELHVKYKEAYNFEKALPETARLR